ncbi:MAG: hypothetical protein ACLSH6_01060 [Limosilactobacillus pontis]
MGETAGTILGVVGAFKVLKTTINGMSAVRQDIKNALHFGGMDQENSKIGHENQELKKTSDCGNVTMRFLAAIQLLEVT